MDGLIQNTQASQKNKKRMHKKNQKKKKEENDLKKRLRPFYSLSSLHTTKHAQDKHAHRNTTPTLLSLCSRKNTSS